MKKTLIILLFSFLLFSPLPAQLRYGLEFGAGINNTFSSYGNKPSFYSRDGMFISYAEKQKWIYEAGLLYELYGVNVSGIPYGNGEIKNMDLSLSYLTLPLSLGYFWDVGKSEEVRLSVKLGFFLSWGIFGSGKIKRDPGKGELIELNIDKPFRDEETGAENDPFRYSAFRRFDSGFFITAEALRKKISLRLTYAIGLRSMNNTFFNDGILKYSLSLGLGFYR